MNTPTWRTSQQLRWKQAGAGMKAYSLLLEDRVIGLLSWPKWLSERAVGRMEHQEWILDRWGCFRKTFVATPEGKETPLARLEMDLFGDGELRLPDGRQYAWFKQGIFCDHWILADACDQALLEIRAGMHWFKRVAEVEIHAAAADIFELPLLMLLSWYLAVANMDDAAAAAAATAGAA